MEFFLKSIGVADELLEHLDQTQLAFQRPAVLWFGLFLLIPVGYFIYRRQNDNLATVSPKLRIALTVTRIMILAILIGVLAGPILKLDHRVVKKPIVAVLFDTSQSMQLPAGPFASDEHLAEVSRAAGFDAPDGNVGADTRDTLNRIGRAELARRVVRASYEQVLEPLEVDFEVRYYNFDRGVSQTVFDPADDDFSVEGGTSSRVGEAIHYVMEQSAGQQVGGMMLFSDGQNTGGRSPSQAARAAAGARAPIFSVPIGSSQRLQDVSLVDVYTSGLVAVGDNVQVHATLESQGFDGRTVTVELKDGDELLDTREVVVRDSEQQQVELTFKAQRPGTRYLSVNVPSLPEETEEMRANNTDMAFVRISKDKMRVLLIDGLPRWDFRFIKNAIRRDNGLAGRAAEVPDVVVESEWRRLSEGQKAAALPRTPEQFAEYHTIIIGDGTPELLTTEFCELLSEAVRNHGVGLVIAAGTQAMPHAFDTTIQELLPVRIKPGVAGMEAPVYKPYSLEITRDGAIHETMRLYDDPGRNRTVWARMPPFHWCAAVERPSPGATVLAWNPGVEGRFGKLPLIAYHYAGEGKVMFVGTDSTWLWRQNVGDRYFYKFWGQAIRFVARVDEAAKKSRIEVRPVRAQPGEEAKIELLAFQENGRPQESETQTVTLLGPGWRDTVDVVADKSKPGRYVGKFTPRGPGIHRLNYQPADGSPAVESTIQVIVSPEEFRHPNLNRPTLELLSSTTGGKVVELSELESIPEQLQGETEQTQLHRQATMWDNWLTLFVLMTIYSVDVAIRRLIGLS